MSIRCFVLFYLLALTFRFIFVLFLAFSIDSFLLLDLKGVEPRVVDPRFRWGAALHGLAV